MLKDQNGTKITTVRDVRGITDESKEAIKNFLLGAVYCWAKNRTNEWFALRNLVGGENADWDETPPYVLFEKHKRYGKNNKDAIKAAAKDAGWILKAVLIGDKKRTYTAGKSGRVSTYRWIGGEP
jgi:hypothetical protein